MKDQEARMDQASPVALAGQAVPVVRVGQTVPVALADQAVPVVRVGQTVPVARVGQTVPVAPMAGVVPVAGVVLGRTVIRGSKVDRRLPRTSRGVASIRAGSITGRSITATPG